MRVYIYVEHGGAECDHGCEVVVFSRPEDLKQEFLKETGEYDEEWVHGVAKEVRDWDGERDFEMREGSEQFYDGRLRLPFMTDDDRFIELLVREVKE